MNEYLKKEPVVRVLAQGSGKWLLETCLTLSDPEGTGRPLQVIADAADERGSFLASASAAVCVPTAGTCPVVLRQTIAPMSCGSQRWYPVRIIVRRGRVTLDMRDVWARLEEQGRTSI